MIIPALFPAPTPAPPSPDPSTTVPLSEHTSSSVEDHTDCDSTLSPGPSEEHTIPSQFTTTSPPNPEFTKVTLDEITTPSPIHVKTTPAAASPTRDRAPDSQLLEFPVWTSFLEAEGTTAQPAILPVGLVKFLQTAPPEVDSAVEDVDKRSSAIGIGVTAIFLLVGFFLFVCVLDTSSWYRDCKKMRRNLKEFKNR